MEPKLQLAVIVTVILVAAGVQLIPWGLRDSDAVLSSIGNLNGQWVNRAAPDFSLPDLDGNVRTLSEFRGKVVFLNFWGSFCAPCREEMPSMERLIRQYEGQGMVMVAVTFDPKKQDADEFMEAFLPGERSSMTVLWDPTSQTGRDYGTELVPETYIIDRKGRVIARFVNAYDWSRPEVKQLIESLLRSDSNTPKLL